MLWVRISLGRGVQHYVITFVSDLRQVGGFLKATPTKDQSSYQDRFQMVGTVLLNFCVFCVYVLFVFVLCLVVSTFTCVSGLFIIECSVLFL